MQGTPEVGDSSDPSLRYLLLPSDAGTLRQKDTYDLAALVGAT